MSVCECVCQPTHSAVQPLDVQSDRLGFLVGGIDKELGFLSLLPLKCAWHRISRCTQDVKHLLGQGCDVNRQALPIRRNIRFNLIKWHFSLIIRLHLTLTEQLLHDINL